MRGYYISELLVGKYYRSNSRPWLQGIIHSAEKREDVYSADNAYHIVVREQQSPYTEFHATVFIAED